MSLHRRGRDIQNLRRLLNREACKKSQLNDTALLWIKPGQPIQSIVERYQVEAAIFNQRHRGVVQRKFVPPVPLGRVSTTRILDQNLPHQLSANRKKMCAIFKV